MMSGLVRLAEVSSRYGVNLGLETTDREKGRGRRKRSGLRGCWVAGIVGGCACRVRCGGGGRSCGEEFSRECEAHLQQGSRKWPRLAESLRLSDAGGGPGTAMEEGGEAAEREVEATRANEIKALGEG